MNNTTHALLINGLGSQSAHFERLRSRYAGTNIVLEPFEIDWTQDAEAYEERFNDLMRRIDTLDASGRKVGLIGYSAGATATLAALASSDKLAGAVTVNGKILNTQKIGNHYYQDNPAFLAGVNKMNGALANLDVQKRSKLLCFRSLYDEVIPVSDMVLPEAASRTTLFVGHVASIALTLYFYPKKIAQFFDRPGSRQ